MTTGDGPTRIRVGPGVIGDAPGPNAYDVTVGHDLLADLPAAVGGARQVLVIHARGPAGLGERVRQILSQAGVRTHLVEIPDAERGKTAEVAQRCWAVLGQQAFTRTDVVVGVGGGAVTDLAGFVAATWLRGVPVVQVPTTALAMVDAAVGGKTGINTDEGKNLVGAFHPPRAVLCDLDTLRTLPVEELAAGMAEVVKTGFIADPVICDLIEADPRAALVWDSPVLRNLVERSIAVKAQVVTQDLTETSLREILNYGHTFGHAIEQVEGYTWRHGRAVSVGMVYAAELGELAGRSPVGLAERHRHVLRSLDLPVDYPSGRWEALSRAMRRDKKTRGELVRFVVLAEVGRPERLEGPAEEQLAAAYARICR
jgi:3-dehydroquinate synthase